MLKFFYDSNIKYLNDMERKLLNIKCGFNLLKWFRIYRLRKQINFTRHSLLGTESDLPKLRDRWFMDDLVFYVEFEGGF